MEKERRLTQGVSISWAVGELGIAAYVGITMSYMLFFLTQALGISPVWAGFALLIPRLWDAGIDPANPPARACVESRLAAPQYMVEIMMIAAK